MNFVKLTEVCDFQGGTQPPKSEWSSEQKSGYIRMLQIRDFTQRHKDYSEYVKDKPTLKKCCSEDILIGRYGASIGKICTGLNGAYNVALIKSIPNTNFLDNDYLKYIFIGENFQNFIQNIGSRAAQAGFNKTDLSEFQIPLPPLEQQIKIAAILDAADAYRQKTKALIAKYEELTQSLFLDMFGDPVKNEKGWEFNKLINLTTQKPDNGFFAKKDKYGVDGTPVVWLTDFIDKLYISENNLRRAQIEAKDKKYILQYGDALFCRSSLNVDGIGKCSIAPISFNEPVIFECHIIRLRFNLSLIIPEYFRFLSDTIFFRDNVMRNAKTSTMTTISQEGISEIYIPVPDIKTQALFRDKINIIVAQKAQAQASLEKAEELFASLLQRAFKGEL